MNERGLVNDDEARREDIMAVESEQRSIKELSCYQLHTIKYRVTPVEALARVD